ncbi:MAG: response regulator transcription factor [Clostridia bacterium]|nr:response regulator transcription factor [Clostridia bacterium]
MNNKYKILLIEDEENIRKFVTALLEVHGYQVLTAKTAEGGISMFSSYLPDLVILDLGLPDKDGTECLQEIRKSFTTPCIVLSARSGEADKVEALDMGANDYVTKPFGSAELLARVRGLLRTNSPRAKEGKLPEGKFETGELVMDYDARKVFLSGAEIHLTQTEFNIVALLSAHFGKVLTYSTIIREIWGYSDMGSIKKLQVNMANIRRKLGIKPGDDRFISNELGVGYRMHADGE